MSVFPCFYTIAYSYQVGEIVRLSDHNGNERKAEVLAQGEDADGEQITTIKYFDDGKEEVLRSHAMTYSANLPIHVMMQIREGLMSVWMRGCTQLKEDEREHIIQSIVTMDRMVGQSMADNMKLLGLPENELCVVLDEEYGYRSHLWFPGMTEAELVEWWKNAESMSAYFFNPATTLPGKVITMQTRDELSTYQAMESSKMFCTAHIHDDDDSSLTTVDGVHHKHKGYNPHLYDSKPGNTVAWMADDGWHHGHYDDKMEIVDDGKDKEGVSAVLDLDKKKGQDE